MCFTDIEKASDRVPRDKLWQVLYQKGDSEHLNSEIGAMYVHCTNYVRISATKGLQPLKELENIETFIIHNCDAT